MTEELFKIPIADDMVTPEKPWDKYNQGFQAGCRSMRADLEAANAERARLILELDKVRAERDAAIEDLKHDGICHCCKKNNICGGLSHRYCGGIEWEWRGVKEAEHNDSFRA